MIGISRQTDYACRILLHLSLKEPGSRVTAREIAGQRLIPHSLIRRIVSQLGVAGFVKTARGTDGGITLSRLPAEISLLDVVEAVEGPFTLNLCVDDPKACPLVPACAVHEVWVKAHTSLVAELRAATFDKLAQRARELSQLPADRQEESLLPCILT